MQVFWLFLVASAFAVATCDEEASSPLDPKDMEAIQEKLTKFNIMEIFFKHLMDFGKVSEESRDDKCLPIGAECHFWSGPNCCGLRTRCVVWDTQRFDLKLKHSIWVSRCREYNLGVALDNIGNWFKNLG